MSSLDVQIMYGLTQAVIGAGASGLLSAREALLQGCQVSVVTLISLVLMHACKFCRLVDISYSAGTYIPHSRSYPHEGLQTSHHSPPFPRKALLPQTKSPLNAPSACSQVTVFEQLPGIGGIWRTSNGWDRSGVEDTTNR